MPTPISSVVNITLSINTIQISGPGFGVPLILSTDAILTDKVSRYSTLAGMISDGYLVSTPAYIAAAAAFAQTPRPPYVLIGRRAHPPTPTWTFTPTVLRPLTKYSLSVDGVVYSFVSGPSAAANDICMGLYSQMQTIPGITITGVTTIHLTGTLAAVHDVQTLTPTILDLVQDNIDGGVATDLADIQLVDNSWYCVLMTTSSKAEILAAAAWVESNRKLFIANSQDSSIINTPATGATDVAAALKTAAYARTALLYSANQAKQPAAAWAGRCLPLIAGSEQWAYKDLAGIPADAMTDSEVANAQAKNCNVYVNIAGVNFTFPSGVSASGEFIDVTRGSDAFSSDLQIAVFSAIATPNKQPLDDTGIAAIKGAIRGVCKDYEDIRFLEKGSSVVVVPKASDLSSADRNARRLSGVSVSAQLAGAILTTNITVTLTP